MTTATHPRTAVSVARHDSPIGVLTIHARGPAISRLDIEADENPALPPCADELSWQPTPLLDEARRQLDDYFARRRFGFTLPLDSYGTDFQEEVWNALTDVPWGTATSYGELAERTGRPLGARAVGGAIRANPVALLVPCHRVLGAGARLTGYTPGRGVPTKRWLLEHEGIDFVG
ncbi:methylated-DNA--[protein]-cysteine S-methyltransferase [Frondihabitans australicus]|uniref:Methylated-DNA--protein-cysteine methyltransferase n=1 Tax=Frondihabitans australicus TaxID=386892 RepID=A0A495ID11_9MICO|nr:methylated-DNA--[protein]-cysteine S-methyltransferase [Frondihabitans australicus]RKR73809.1 methylated-DNA-[protein]-cysteine S-methyltransferase [Frondihabitans australicus]